MTETQRIVKARCILRSSLDQPLHKKPSRKFSNTICIPQKQHNDTKTTVRIRSVGNVSDGMAATREQDGGRPPLPASGSAFPPLSVCLRTSHAVCQSVSLSVAGIDYMLRLGHGPISSVFRCRVRLCTGRDP